MSEDVQYSHPSDIPGLTLGTARFEEFRFEPHYHLDCHIGLVARGVQRQSFRGESLLLARGAIQLMPAGEVHDGIASANGSYTLQTFRLSSALLDRVGEEITGKHYFPSLAAVVLQDSRLADELLNVHAILRQGATDRMLNETYVLELLESLFARLEQPAPQTITGNLSSQQLRVVRDFAEAHISDKIVLEDLSLLIGLDRFRFLKLFKRTVGMTPHAWLLRLRLEKAVALINASRNMSITDIAHAVGFFDQSHFTRAFRQAYGVTPARF
ncbi:AraC family transcriptional regulator [Paraburkholderia bryophila]|uniref:helix-turn-helix transcriptional regulator n=1 Tax=Paraburkholderia bryophila TaxID=420952 RepID=UPI00234B9DCE|nr:AraC family transcriptional regulator [Paraburkholderia bryophila]WCM22496.1 AraC family transcriptional regulator [Paraburkholderia bryophila]